MLQNVRRSYARVNDDSRYVFLRDGCRTAYPQQTYCYWRLPIYESPRSVVVRPDFNGVNDFKKDKLQCESKGNHVEKDYHIQVGILLPV